MVPLLQVWSFEVKVTCHNGEINFCGKSFGSGDGEAVVWVGVSGRGVGDSRNGNGNWV